MNFRKYFEIARIGFQEESAYRLNALTGMAGSLIQVILYYHVWKAISASGTLNGSFEGIITYIVIGQMVAGTSFVSIEGFIGEKIRNGTLVNELKRPISLFSQAVFRSIGKSVFRIFTRSIPVLVVGITVFDIGVPSALKTLAFILSVVLSLLLVILTSYSASMLVFWTKIDWSISSMRRMIQSLFSGIMFPLYLLPESVESIFYILPFQAMVDTPIRIYTSSDVALAKALGLQVFWTFALFLVAHLAWKKARKKLTVQGG
ncbi:ABC transporter permease [Candidatus Nanohalococcus occultus]|uniref:ABC transporter permease n=1 Tax=Candidatus Nanohalococcus occultus TaxID=2978047 RepID=UPI0039E1DB60